MPIEPKKKGAVAKKKAHVFVEEKTLPFVPCTVQKINRTTALLINSHSAHLFR